MEKKKLDTTTLILAYKAMLYVADQEGVDVDEKHHDLHDALLTDYDCDVTEMVDRLEEVYQLIPKPSEDE